jgi:hypothetical protein
VRLGIFVEERENVDEVHSADRVAADADASRLADAEGSELADRLVGEGAGARNDADVARQMDLAGHDADFASAGGDDARAVRTDEANGFAVEPPSDADHVHDRDALGDANDEGAAGVGGLEDRVGSAGRGNEDERDVRARFLDGFGDRVEHGNFAFEFFAAATGCDAGHDVGSVVHALLGMERTGSAGDALDDDARVFVDEDGHG